MDAEPRARLIQAGRATPHPAAEARQQPVVARPALIKHDADEDDWSSF